MSVRPGLYGEKKDVIYLQADATSLADLKAEMVRKKAEATQNRQKGNYRPEKNDDKKKKANIWSKENSGLLARMQRDMEVKAEEERTWQKSKSIMERKSKIYNSLKEGKGRSEISSRFLVDFEGRRRDSSSSSDSDSDSGGGRRRKRDSDYPAKDEEEEWVEYTDSLGRTRTCMRKDLKRLQNKEKDLSRKKDPATSSEDEEKRAPRHSDEEPDLLSEDMRRDMLRQKWEKEELENLTKDSLHYSDVRFDEARNHGAGFYAFSKDEETRSKEQVTLKNLHAETNEARREKEKKAEKRKREMAERVRRIKQKRREKMGLPPLEDEPETTADNKDSNSDTETDFTKSVEEGLRQFRQSREAEEKRSNEIKRRENLRDWDIGKEGLDDMKKEWKVLTQQEWNEKQRSERKPEFAPPTAFMEARNLLQKKENDFIQAQEKKRKAAKEKPRFNPFNKASSSGMHAANMPPSTSQSKPTPQPGLYSQPPPPIRPNLPPPTNQYDGPINQYNFPPPPLGLGQQGVPPEVNDEYADPPQSTSRQDPMAQLDSSGVAPYPTVDKKKPLQSYSTAMRLDLHRKMMEQDFLPEPAGLNNRIINELDQLADEDGDSEDEEEEKSRGRGNEVAPPATMEYYSSGPRPGTSKASKTRHDVADAFNIGLNAMKK